MGGPYKEGVGHVTFFSNVQKGYKDAIRPREGPYVTRLALSNGIGGVGCSQGSILGARKEISEI